MLISNKRDLFFETAQIYYPGAFFQIYFKQPAQYLSPLIKHGIKPRFLLHKGQISTL